LNVVEIEWTLSELVAAAVSSIATLPAPKNGQVRAVPDERTVRYYGTLGLLDKPLAMRGRTALYGRRHLAQVVAIKRLQGVGRSLAEIQALWSTLDDATLARMSGVDVGGKRAGRRDFWKTPPKNVGPATGPPRTPYPVPPRSLSLPHVSPVELRVELATGATLVIAVPSDVAISPADVAALRAAAAPLVTELARRGLTTENAR
jgi:DNA-binding transcriptional MerR regulator